MKTEYYLSYVLTFIRAFPVCTAIIKKKKKDNYIISPLELLLE